MSQHLGELAALATAMFFAASSTVNTLAGRKVGSNTVNQTRLALAIVWLVLAHWLFGISLPTQAGAERWLWLSISGVIGLAIGDALLFQSFIMIGPRLAMLLMALAPAMAALLAWIFLNEKLTNLQLVGLLLSLLGVTAVVLDRRWASGSHPIHKKVYIIGILLGLGAALGQALGVIFARRGLTGDFPALSGTLIRMLAAGAFIFSLNLLSGRSKNMLGQLRAEPKATRYMLIGSVLGPFLGVTLSLYALQHTQVGIASTLSALSPVFLLPIGYIFFKERYGWPSVLGTMLALAGVAIFFLQ